MTNLHIVIAYAPFLIFSATALRKAYLLKPRTDTIRAFLLMGAMNFCWQLVTCLFLLEPQPGRRLFLYNMNLPFVAFSTLALLLFAIRFYRLERYLSGGLVALLCVLPALTTIFCLTSPYHSLINLELIVQADGPLYQMHLVHGLWFWVHTFYCYLLLGITIFIVVYKHVILPTAYRFCSALLIVAIAVAILSNLVTLFFFLGTPFDASIIGVGISLVLMYVSMSNNERMDFYMIARNEIFNYLDAGIFILDKDKNIIAHNTKAHQLLDECGVDQGIADLLGLTTQLEERGAVFTASLEDTGVDVALSNLSVNKVYNIQEQLMQDQGGQHLGSFVTCTDVTQNRQLIKWLEQTAGMDALTNLANRQKFHLSRSSYDLPENLPMAVIMGDVNGLKEVNDNLGHGQGDLLLQTVALAMDQSRPQRATCFRMGGDEFLMLIPRCTREEADEVILRIDIRLAELENDRFTPSISLGCAFKTHPGEDLDEIINQADKTMYTAKRGSRG